MMLEDQIRAKALHRAIRTAGGIRKLAKLVGKSTPAVAAWKQRNKVTAESVLNVERATGVSRHLIRPDIYPIEDAEKNR